MPNFSSATRMMRGRFRGPFNVSLATVYDFVFVFFTRADKCCKNLNVRFLKKLYSLLKCLRDSMGVFIRQKRQAIKAGSWKSWLEEMFGFFSFHSILLLVCKIFFSSRGQFLLKTFIDLKWLDKGKLRQWIDMENVEAMQCKKCAISIRA